MNEEDELMEALENMDDYARMADINQIGAYKTLKDGIETLRAKLAECQRELEAVKVELSDSRSDGSNSFASYKLIEGELTTTRQQLDIAVKALEKIAENRNQSLSLCSMPPIDSRAFMAEQALAAIQSAQKCDSTLSEAKKEGE